MTAARVARRLLRKIAKPVALWLNAQALRDAEERADHFYCLRVQSVPLEREERKRQIALTARRNQIAGW